LSHRRPPSPRQNAAPVLLLAITRLASPRAYGRDKHGHDDERRYGNGLSQPGWPNRTAIPQFRAWQRPSGRPDCGDDFARALAKLTDEALLYTSGDFARTDVACDRAASA
jgi:hypothetical protein